MPDDRALLERLMADAEVRSFTLDEFHRRRHRKQRNRRIATAVMGLAVAAVVAGSVLSPNDETVDSDVLGPLPSPFAGEWTSTDSDGSSQTMEIVRTDGDEHEVVARDDAATACSGAPSTLTGTGLLTSVTELVLPQPALTCDDGNTPSTPDGPLRQEELADLAFFHDPDTDVLRDSLGIVWRRSGAIGGGDESGTSIDPPPVVLQMVDSLNTGDVAGFIGAFAPDGLFAPRGDFEESELNGLFGNKLYVAEVPLVDAWFAINAAWGTEVELRSCTVIPVPMSGVGEGVDASLECEVATRWHTLSTEITEGWDLELRGDEVVWWGASPDPEELELLDLDPSERSLQLGYAGLQDWEAWLRTNHPEDAAAWLNPRGVEGAIADAIADPELAARLVPLLTNAERTWVIEGHRFTPLGFVPYDPAFAPEIGASIGEYLKER